MAEHEHPPEDRVGHTGDRLDSWKEIAAYLGRDVRTVQRWEANEGLPVHRHAHASRASVYAHRSELDAWGVTRRQGLEVTRLPLWRRPRIVTGVVAALVLVGMAALVWRAGTPSLPFQEDDWILITAFDNRTGNPLFDGLIEYALARELSQSPFMHVVPRDRVNDTLDLMRRPRESRIDLPVAHEIAARDGDIRALLTGRVELIDATYRLSVELIDPDDGMSAAATHVDVVGDEEVIAALTRLSDWTRDTLGELRPPMAERPEALEKATTPSLHALKLYSQAMALFLDGFRDMPVAEALLKQAVAEDPGFASAHILLAYAIVNQVPFSAATIALTLAERAPASLPHAERAVALAPTTPDRERHFIMGSYHTMTGRWEDAAVAYQALVELHPNHFWGVRNLGAALRRLDKRDDAIQYTRQAADLRPNNSSANFAAFDQLRMLGDRDAARPYYERVIAIAADTGDVDTTLITRVAGFRAELAVLEGDASAVLREADRIGEQTEIREDVHWRTVAELQCVRALMYVSVDRLQKGRALLALGAPQYPRNSCFTSNQFAGDLTSSPLPRGFGSEVDRAVLWARRGDLPEARAAIDRLATSAPGPRVDLRLLEVGIAIAQGELATPS